MAQRASERLNHAVAARVVRALAERIDYPVNIMDERGVIIASSDPGRVGQTHDDALRALTENHTIVSYEPDATTGRQPGVNVPLYLDGRLRGVVGVTGAPEAVTTLAQLISLTVQLLLDQREEHRLDTLHTARASDMLSGLISGSSSEQALTVQLRDLGLTPPWTLSRITLDEGNTVKSTEHSAVLTIDRTAWVLSSGAHGSHTEIIESRQAVRGRPHTDVQALLVDAENFRALGAHAGLMPSAETCGEWNEELALATARAPEAHCRQVAARTEALGPEQARTLTVLSVSASQQEAAEKLNVHRNTLIQRMDRVRTVTGLDPRVPSELMSLLNSVYARARLGELHIF